MFNELKLNQTYIISFSLQIDSYCRTNGLVIAGYYQANETLGELG